MFFTLRVQNCQAVTIPGCLKNASHSLTCYIALLCLYALSAALSCLFKMVALNPSGKKMLDMQQWEKEAY